MRAPQAGNTGVYSTVALSDNDRVGTTPLVDSGVSIRFDDFFPNTAARPDENDRVVVSLSASGDGSSPTPRTLSALTLTEARGTAVDLSPAFVSELGAYRATVVVPSLTVAATPTDSGASVLIFPADSDLTTAGHQVALATTGTEIAVTVTNGGDSETYIVAVNRPAAFWSATLGVGTGGSGDGYDFNRGRGTLANRTFTAPGDIARAIETLIWDPDADSELALRIVPHPAESVYEVWTLSIDGVAVSLSEIDADFGSSFRLPDFFGDAPLPGVNEQVDVALFVFGGGGRVGVFDRTVGRGGILGIGCGGP